MLCCSLHIRRGSEPFAALPPQRIAKPSITLPLLSQAIHCLCRTKHSFAFACQSKACVTTPLPILALLRLCLAILALPSLFVTLRYVALALRNFAELCGTLPLRRFSLQFHSTATHRFSVANIASHAAAKPDYSLPLPRSPFRSRAFANRSKSLQCRCHTLHSKAVALRREAWLC